MSNLKPQSDQNESLDKSSYQNIFNDAELKKIYKQISQLSYEDSLEQLDIIMNKLQSEDILVDELQKNYFQAKLYLEHCDQLLAKLEQEIITINT